MLRVVIQCLFLLILFSKTSFSLTPHKIPRLNPFYRSILRRQYRSSSSSDRTTSATSDTQFKTYYYNQTLDHFNYGPQSYATFKHRYIINSNFWGGAQSNSPIFAWLGAESSIDSDPLGIGFLTDNAPRFKALLVYIEHRYYGESIPFGTMEEAMDDDTTRGYFNSAQALADYAEVLLYIKKEYSAQDCPVIVFGGSYGGMLASWFRLKYPHVSLGALASSAPVLYFDDITPQNGYYSIVTKDFREVSESCYQTIKESWSIIDKIASKPYGLSILRRKFKLCQDLNSSWELKDYLDEIYCEAAQYNSPPEYPVTMVCGAIDGAPKEAHILDRIHAGVVASEGNQPCYNVSAGETPPASPGEDDEIWGWNWQVTPFNLQRYSQFCIDNFGIPPRPHWVTTYYGGHDIKFVLRNFGSNIIFSNGLRDPYSIAGVLENISDTILAVYTQNGATDPNWLTEQRNKEIEIIQSWITKYYADLQALKK
nr:lysosomal Pro-X carboxypeptidase-like [Ipomoea batatas]